MCQASGYLSQSRLILTSSPIKATKASTGTRTIITFPSARTISAGFIPISSQWIGSAGTFLKFTGWSTISRITETSQMFHGIPGHLITTIGFGSQQFLWPAFATIIAIIGTHCSLTGNAVITGKAITSARGTITDALVRTYF
jgi:hypothetical protein